MSRALLVGAVILCLLPLIILGPSLFRDFVTQGRWDPVADMHVAEVNCIGRAPIMQFCGFGIYAADGSGVDYVPAAIVLRDVSSRPGGVIRARNSQHLSTTALATPSGMSLRLAAILVLQFLVIFATAFVARQARAQRRRADDANARRRTDLVSLSRDRRDHF